LDFGFIIGIYKKVAEIKSASSYFVDNDMIRNGSKRYTQDKEVIKQINDGSKMTSKKIPTIFTQKTVGMFVKTSIPFSGVNLPAAQKPVGVWVTLPLASIDATTLEVPSALDVPVIPTPVAVPAVVIA
jgi:hypothetical protein